ncbi:MULTISPECIES: GspH/FimT family pseudopilin [unclassified Moraxella]|uniref:GspH/FimT family pseudopilin n=1 Tax=unclassified Moraxella TaxID=2685852 RepID=UPI003AF64C71
MSRPIKLSNIAGFTLVEMIVTVAILGIIASMAVPSMQQQINNMKIKEVANSFETAIKEARTQALINQRSTNLVLDSKTADTDKKLTLSLLSPSTVVATYVLPKKLVVTTTPTTLTAISFSPQQVTYQGSTASGTVVTTAQFTLCMDGEKSDKYIITVNAKGNTTVTANGSCS